SRTVPLMLPDTCWPGCCSPVGAPVSAPPEAPDSSHRTVEACSDCAIADVASPQGKTHKANKIKLPAPRNNTRTLRHKNILQESPLAVRPASVCFPIVASRTVPKSQNVLAPSLPSEAEPSPLYFPQGN